MPKRLDLHVAKSVLACFALGVLAVFGLFVFIDLFSRISSLPPSPDLPLPLHLARYYLLMFPDLFLRADSIIFCYSCLFVLARMQRHRQTVAVLAGGISTHRLVAVMLVLALLLGQAGHLLQETVGPSANRLLFLVYQKKKPLKSRSSKTIQFRDKITFHTMCGNVIFKDDHGLDMLELENVDFKTGNIQHLHLSLFDTQARPKAKIYAQEALWKDQRIFIKQGTVFPYVKEDFPMINHHWRFDGAEVIVHIPLTTAFFSGIGPEMLTHDELAYFLHDPDMFAELTHRWLRSLLMMSTLVICLSLCMPLLHIKPVVAFFLCLISCLLSLTIFSLTRSSLANESMTLDICLTIALGTPIGFYLLGKWLIPT